MNQEQCYLSLDLELNNAPDNSTINPKIIQVGIAIGSYLNYKNNSIAKYKWYLDPQEPIFEFITNLTGISNEDIIRNAVSHERLAKEIGELIQAHQCFINPITWGGGDSTELKLEFTNQGTHFPYFGRRWIDVKTWYTLHMLTNGKKPSGGLSSALGNFRLHFEGQPHRADDDALNTLRLFFEVMQRQHRLYQLVKDVNVIKI
jgi:inhibitor of KinA sporulation pathway (predicted exonuclease)